MTKRLTSGYAFTGIKWAVFMAAAIFLAGPFTLSLPGTQEIPSASEERLATAISQQPSAPTNEIPTAIQASASAQSSPFTVRGTLALDSDVEPGDFAWSDEGVPPGPISVVVDIEAERIYVYRGGIEIGRSFFIYGADDKPTPFGTFKILQKKRDHISNLYDAPMPFMLRLTNDGIAIHASDMISYNAATHGCIGLPDEFAALLFAQAKVGDPVLVTKDWLPQVYAADAAAGAPTI